MKTRFDLEESIKKWATENGHAGFYNVDPGNDPCGCKLNDIAPCGMYEGIFNGDCVGGKLWDKEFINSIGEECEWAIVPHDYKED